jgi:hypothetical protein
VEIGGPGFAQARENLKKIRGLIRRIQNRGYVTLGRLADYFAGLVAGGDESNAIIDAADAVNLMTVHAAKGLEFPVVFIVNIGKGSGGSRDDIRVTPAPFAGDDEDDADPVVAITDHESAGDRDDEEREHEETKRLLYVALTRARDRLYLAGTVANARLVLQRGSIGRVLPASLPAAMAMVGGPEAFSWSGAVSTHILRRVPPAGAVPLSWRTYKSGYKRLNDTATLPVDGRRRGEIEPSSSPMPVDSVEYSWLDGDGRVIRGRFSLR